MSIVLSSFWFPRKGRYDVVISEGLHALPVLVKLFSLRRHSPKATAIMDNETLSFSKSGFYPERTRRQLIRTMSRFDGLICVGEFQREIAEKVLAGQKRAPRLLSVHSSVSDCRVKELSELSPDLGNRKLTFIGNGPSGWRSWYKGLDLLLDAMQIVAKQCGDVILQIIGEWDEQYTTEMLNARPELRNVVNFVGKTGDIGTFSKNRRCTSILREAKRSDFDS